MEVGHDLRPVKATAFGISCPMRIFIAVRGNIVPMACRRPASPSTTEMLYPAGPQHRNACGLVGVGSDKRAVPEVAKSSVACETKL